MGDQTFYPGFRYADNQRETISGTKYPPDLLTSGHFTRPVDFSRDRHPDKEVGAGSSEYRRFVNMSGLRPKYVATNTLSIISGYPCLL